MTKRFLIGLVAVLVMAWGMTTSAHAGESGTYSGFLGFHSVGTMLLRTSQSLLKVADVDNTYPPTLKRRVQDKATDRHIREPDGGSNISSTDLHI